MKKILFDVVCRSPNGKIEPFENFLKNVFNKNKNFNKNYHIAGDLNLNLLDDNKNKESQIIFKINMSKWYDTNLLELLTKLQEQYIISLLTVL